MAGTNDFEWPEAPEADAIALAPDSPTQRLGSPTSAPRPTVRHGGRGLVIATFMVLGHALALVAAQIIAATVVSRHPDSDRVREASQLLDDSYPVMIALHVLAALLVVIWALQASVQRRTFWLITASAMHCILVAVWWSLFELA